MITATTRPSTGRPPAHPTDQQAILRADRPDCERALPACELVALAERHAAVGDQGGLDALRTEAERRARGQAPDSLAAQIAGYIGLLAEDHEHALADEAHTWSRELHRELREALGPASAAVPVPRQVCDRAVRS